MTASAIAQGIAKQIASGIAAGDASGGGGGGGAASSTPVTYQQLAYPGVSFNNVTGAQSFNMPNTFQGGKDVVVPIAWFGPSTTGITGVTVNGVAAVRRAQGAGTTARLDVWVAQNVPAAGNKQVTITPAAGAGWYINAAGIECSPLVAAAADQVADTTNSSTTPNGTTPATTQAAELVVGLWRDNSGVINAAGTPVTAPLTPLWYQADGSANLGGASGFRITDRMEAQAAAFAVSTATVWFELTAALKFVLPVTFVGYTFQLWGGSNAYTPPTLSYVSGAATGCLVTCFAGWNSNRLNGQTFPLPTDNNGTFVGNINPVGANGGTGELQLGIQICDQFNPSVATHTITPAPLNVDDDGCFTCVYIPGVTARRCTGYTRQYHAPFGAVGTPDPSTYQNCSVTTTGSVPQVGDIFVATFGMDPNSDTTHNPNADVNWQVPAGCAVVAQRYDVRDITGHLTLVGVVTAAGHLTINPTDTDPCTFWFDGGIAVYRP